MSPELEDLARDLVTLPWWRWAPGTPWVREGSRGWITGGSRPPRLIRQGVEVVALPDLANNNLGWLLALVREAWGDDSITTTAASPRVALRWELECWAPDLTRLPVGPWATEAHALVAALEAAPSALLKACYEDLQYAEQKRKKPCTACTAVNTDSSSKPTKG